MSTAVHYRPHAGLSADSVHPEGPGAGEVQIAVSYVGICGTDMHIYRGHMDQRVGSEAVLGHEMSGRISQLGAGVEGWERGQAVTVFPVASCHDCETCRRGYSHVCPSLKFRGIDSPGAMQQLWTVPAEALVALPEGLSLKHAALSEPLAVAVHDVRRARLSAGERVLVVGGGPVGLLVGWVAGREGVSVTVLEPDPARRAVASAIGLAALDPSAPEVQAQIADAGQQADVAFEVSGTAPGMETAMAALAPRGRLVLVGIHAEPRTIDLHRFFWRELEMYGARLYSREDFAEAAELLAGAPELADAMITDTVALDDAADAFQLLARGGVMKVLVDCGAGAGEVSS